MTAPVHISPRIEILVRNGHLEPYKDEIFIGALTLGTYFIYFSSLYFRLLLQFCILTDLSFNFKSFKL